jgi:hypothetical protein
MKPICIVAALLLAATGCATDERPESDTAGDRAAAPTGASARATLAARVANDIARTPAAADSILSAAGYTAESFERLMYEIAADSAEAAAYAAARVP